MKLDMKKSLICLLILAGCAALVGETQKTSLVQMLDSEAETGQISRAEYLAYRLMSLTGSEALPEKYRGCEPDESRMGTSLKMEARSLVDSATGSDKRLLQSVLSRPVDLPLSQISPSGLFKLHYTHEQGDAAADTFITQCAQAYDDVYDLIVNQLGYPAPPIDDIAEPEYDIYVYNLSGYGMTTAESAAPRGSYPHAYTSYIEMDNDFRSTYTRGVDGMLVTAAHEFFHIVQIGMRSYTIRIVPSAWLYEGMATWMEDYAYDEINDYLQYLPHYLSTLDRSFNTFNGLHEYGSCIFYHMLEQKYGADILKTVWQEFATEEVWDALDNALKTIGSSLASEFADHMLWNYFTGERADLQRFYAEGDMYPLVEPANEYDISDALSFSDVLEPMSADFVIVQPQVFGQLLIDPFMDNATDWMVGAVLHPYSGEADASVSGGANTILFSQVNPADQVVIIPTSIKIAKNGMGNEEYRFNLNVGEVTGIEPGIQYIKPNPFQPDVHANGLTVCVRLSKKTKKINWVILNETGATVLKVTDILDSEKNGDFEFSWDGTNANGDPVAAGIYIIYVDAGDEIAPGKIAVIH